MNGHYLVVAIEPMTKAYQDRLDVALNQLAVEDPWFRFTSDRESGHTIIKGMGELHLEIIVDRIKGEFKVDANVGVPRVAYCAALRESVEVDYTHTKIAGPICQFGSVKVQVTPGKRGSGVVFIDEVKGGNIPREFIPSVEKGMRETADTGGPIGFPIIDFTIRLIDGKYHDVDSSALAFEITGRGAMREGAQKAGIKLIEPIMKLAVVTPKNWFSEVSAELTRRTVSIEHELIEDTAVVIATGLMVRLLGFESWLRNVSSAQARVAMIVDHYAEVEGFQFDPDDRFPAAAALRA